MRRKLFTFLVAFLATLSGAVWGETIQLNNLNNGAKGTGWEYNNNVLTLAENSNGFELTGTNENLRVLITQSCSVTLNNAVIKYKANRAIDNESTFALSNDVNLDLIILGENEIESLATSLWPGTTRLTGIEVPNGAVLTTNAKSTGLLKVTGRVAIGTSSAFNSRNSSCGTINIEGGTIEAIGEGISIDFLGIKFHPISVGGGTLFGTQSGTLNVDNNGVLIAEKPIDIPGITSDYEFSGGIVFNASNEGYVHGNKEVILQSPLDLENRKIHIGAGKTLTIGEGYVVTNAEEANIDNQGTLNAYRIKYTLPELPEYVIKPEFKVAGLLCGKNTTRELANWTGNLKDTDQSEKSESAIDYQQLQGYWLEHKADGTCSYKTGSFSTEQTDPSGEVVYTYTPVWTLSKNNIHFMASTGMSVPFPLWLPEEAPFDVSEKTPTLAEVGMQRQSTTSNMIEKLNPYTPLDPTEVEGAPKEPKKVELTLTPEGISASASTATLEVHIRQLGINIGSDDDLEFKVAENLSYTGQPKTKAQVLTIIHSHQGLSPEVITPALYKLEYKEENAGGDAEYKKFTETDGPKDAGKYKLRVSEIESGGVISGMKEVDKLLDIAKVKLEAEVSKEVSFKVGDTDIDWKSKVKLNNVVPNETVEYNVSVDIKKGGGSTEEWKTTPGTYDVYYTITLTNANNYYIDPTGVEGTLTVTKETTSGGDLTPGDGDGDDNDWKWNGNDAYELTYDGNPHPIKALTVKLPDDKIETLSVDNSDFSVTYGENSSSAPLDAGNYTANITITKEGYAQQLTLPLRIIPANLSIKFKDDKGSYTTKIGVNPTVSTDDLEANGLVNGETVTLDGEITLSKSVNINSADEYESAFDLSKVTLSAPAGSKFKEPNYNVQRVASGNLTVEKYDGDDDDNLSYMVDGASGTTVTYDGKSHKITALNLKVGEETKSINVTKATYTATPSATESTEVAVNAGTYDVTITSVDDNEWFDLPKDGLKTQMVISKRSIDITIKDFTEADLGKTKITNDEIKSFGDIVKGEDLTVSGNVEFEKIKGEEYKYTAKFSGLTVASGTKGNKYNYEVTFKYGTKEITGGNGDVEIDVKKVTLPEDSGWKLSDDGTYYYRTYDGERHPITSVMVGDRKSVV